MMYFQVKKITAMLEVMLLQFLGKRKSAACQPMIANTQMVGEENQGVDESDITSTEFQDFVRPLLLWWIKRGSQFHRNTSLKFTVIDLMNY